MSREQAPVELGLDPSQCLRLKRCWYGRRDAGQAFEFVVRDDLEVNNFSQGAYSPCVHGHKTPRLWHSVHGDDRVGLGDDVYLEWYRRQVRKRLCVS